MTKDETIQRDPNGETNDFTMTGASAWIQIDEMLLYIVKRPAHGGPGFIEIRRDGHTAVNCPDEIIMFDRPNPLAKIRVEVSGGVASCDDPRVEIIDHDNLAESGEAAPSPGVRPLDLVCVDGEDVQRYMAESDPPVLIKDDESMEFLRFLHGQSWTNLDPYDRIADMVRLYYEDFKKTPSNF